MIWTIKVNAFRRKDFDVVIGWIKAAGGTYDPNTKTWALDSKDPLKKLDEVSYGRAHFYADCMTITTKEHPTNLWNLVGDY